MFRPQSRFDQRASASENIVYMPVKEGLPPTKAAAYGGRVSKPLTAKPLSKDNRSKFVQMLRQLKSTRKIIRSAMKFCLDNAEMATEITEILSEALTTNNKNTSKKLARLNLLNDVLHNSSSMMKNASAFPAEFKKTLPGITRNLHDLSKVLKDEEKTIFDEKVLKLFDIWNRQAIYTKPYLDRLSNIFLGLPEFPVQPPKTPEPEKDKGKGLKNIEPIKTDSKKHEKKEEKPEIIDDVLDGAPMEEDDEAEINGVPFEEDVDGIPF